MSDAYNTSPAFSNAAQYMSNAPSLSNVSNALKLELYGLFKILTVSPSPNTSRPSFFDMTGRAKWDAWAQASKDYEKRVSDAEQRYLDISRELGWKEDVSLVQIKPSDDDSDGSLDYPESRGGGGGGGGGSGMGVAVSTLARPQDEDASGKGSSELHSLAVQDDGLAIVLLIDASPGMDVNARDDYGYTALHLAADRGSFSAVKALLSKGADRSLEDPDEFTALALAKVAGHDDIVALLESE
ncbi:ankyrin repeat-containing domain protein [Amylostereum chailletii]|nr:ankyrin repeat-containing domain protein [Amylostereum chailletii]